MATPTSLPATFVAGNVLTAAQMNDLRGAFRILQVVQVTESTQFATTSTSDVAVPGLSVTITPSSATSKVLLMASVPAFITTTSNLFTRFYRGSVATGTNLAGAGLFFSRISADASPTNTVGLHFLDSPATTSATTYNVAVQVSAGTGYVMFGSTLKSVLTAVEVSA